MKALNKRMKLQHQIDKLRSLDPIGNVLVVSSNKTIKLVLKPILTIQASGDINHILTQQTNSHIKIKRVGGRTSRRWQKGRRRKKKLCVGGRSRRRNVASEESLARNRQKEGTPVFAAEMEKRANFQGLIVIYSGRGAGRVPTRNQTKWSKIQTGRIKNQTTYKKSVRPDLKSVEP